MYNNLLSAEGNESTETYVRKSIHLLIIHW